MKTPALFVLTMCFVLVGCPAIEVARTTCTSDTECKGARICDEGTCIDPPQADGVAQDTLDGFGVDSTADAEADAVAEVAEVMGFDGVSDTLADSSETSPDTQDTAGGDDVEILDVAETLDATEEVAADADGGGDGDSNDAADASEDVDTLIPPDADPPPSLCPTFEDEFETNSLDAWWTEVFPDHVGVESGELALTVTAAPSDEFVRAALSLPKGFEGATATVEVGKLASANAVMRLWVQRLPSSLNQNTEISISSGSVAVRYNGEGGNTLVVKTDYDGTVHRWLRLVHTGGEMLYQTSADGAVFETLASVDLPFPLDSVNVAIAAANSVALDADETVTAASFQLICGE